MTSSDRKFRTPARYLPENKNVWVEFHEIAQQQKNIVDLGQGSPNFLPPEHLREAFQRVATSQDISMYQYPRELGHERLVVALAKLYSHLTGIQIEPFSEILVTMGAFGALFNTIFGFVEEGDEVIIIEPYFYCYDEMVRAAGGVSKFIPLRFRPKNNNQSETATSADFILDDHELEMMFNDKTKAIILNTPHNPIGKVFTEEELTKIANLCKKWDVLVISDEVYEWAVYKPNKHLRIATLKDMWQRTITIGSANKTFSVPGWRVGWAYGPADLLRHLVLAYQNSTLDGNMPMQAAIAMGFEYELQRFEEPECYFRSLTVQLEGKRDFMIESFKEAGLKPIVPQAGTFIMVDYSAIENMADLSTEIGDSKDYRMAKWIIRNLGVLGIPPSCFYSSAHKVMAQNYMRFTFIKDDEMLQKAATIFKKLDEKNKSSRKSKINGL